MSKSNNTAIIGNGLIGQRLQKFIKHNWVFDSKNINTMPDYDIDTVYIAAPSSNRVWATQNPELDWDSVELLKLNLLKTAPRQVVLISTCDTQVSPDTAYGKHRLDLENLVQDFFHYYTILRLPSLIGDDITKNIIYDIKHSTPWVDKINVSVKQQWYILDDLEEDVKRAVERSQSITNLVSEPILNKEITDQFSKLDEKAVNIDKVYNLHPYKYYKDEIFEAIRLYMR